MQRLSTLFYSTYFNSEYDNVTSRMVGRGYSKKKKKWMLVKIINLFKCL